VNVIVDEIVYIGCWPSLRVLVTGEREVSVPRLIIAGC
jgi:hypothetical protein